MAFKCDCVESIIEEYECFDRPWLIRLKFFDTVS